MRRQFALLVASAVLISVSACSSSQKQANTSPPTTAPTTSTSQPASASVAASLAPLPPASDFVAVVSNPWFPLKPGSKWVYRGVKDGKPTIDTFVVTKRTRVVLGVPTTVVMDTLTSDGHVVEATEDWYAQDNSGNVWYFGEDTKEFDKNGKVTTTSGSWEAGVNGAKAGLFMPADPQIGMSFYQEFLKGEAEDAYEIVSLTASITVPSGTYNSTLMTKESTVLEPGIVTQKNYAKGIGEVYENDTKGPVEYSKLVTYTVR